MRNPEEASLKGNWSDPQFLRNVARPQSKAQAHAVRRLPRPRLDFRAVFKHDRKGNCWTRTTGQCRISTTREKFDKAVHLTDIHLDKGMHCVDCHFEQDTHGNGHLYGEVAAAVEIDCADCHGTIRARADAAAPRDPRRPTAARDLSLLRTPFGRRRFEWAAASCPALHAG